MSAVQQVNLYPHAGKKIPVGLTARRALIAVVVTAGGLLLCGLILGFTNRQLDQTLNRLSNETAPLQQQVEQLTAAVAQRQPDPDLKVQLQGLQKQQRWQVRAVQELTAITPGQQVGFSSLLRELAQVRVVGVWLEAIEVDRGMPNLVLEGRAQSSELIPLYLQALQHVGSLSGLEFNGLLVEPPEVAGGSYRFRLMTARGEEPT